MKEIEEAKRKMEEVCDLLQTKQECISEQVKIIGNMTKLNQRLEEELKITKEENSRLRCKNKDLIAKISETKEENRVLRKEQFRGKGKLQDLTITIARSQSN